MFTEEFLVERFGDYPLIRIDRDATARKGSLERLLARLHEAGPALFSDFIRRGRPNCGRLDRQKLEYLFGPQAGETGSAALIRVGAGACSRRPASG